MKLNTLVRRELFERKSQMLTCFLAIFLGITTVVAIKNVTYYSEKAVAREMDSLGALRCRHRRRNGRPLRSYVFRFHSPAEQRHHGL